MPHRTGVPDRDPERLVRDYADLVLRVCYTYLRTTADDAMRQRLSRARVSLRKTLKGGFDDFSA